MSSELTRHNGDAIRALRIKSGYKPGAFATKAQVSYAHLDNLENERKEASVEVIYRIAAALDVSARAIVRDPSSLVIAEDIPA